MGTTLVIPARKGWAVTGLKNQLALRIWNCGA